MELSGPSCQRMLECAPDKMSVISAGWGEQFLPNMRAPVIRLAADIRMTNVTLLRAAGIAASGLNMCRVEFHY